MTFEPVKSGNIASAGYDEATKSLVVNFSKGGSYRYSNVPKDEWVRFRSTFQSEASSGSHLHKHIKKYPCSKA